MKNHENSNQNEKQYRLFLVILLITLILSFPLSKSLASENIQSDSIGTVIVKKSGFFSDSKLMIKYRKSDKKIVAVVEDNEVIEKNKFYKYNDNLKEILNFDEIESILPELEKINDKIISSNLTKKEKIMQIEEIETRLNKLDDNLARTQKEILKVQKGVINLEIFVDSLIQILSSNDLRIKNEFEIKFKNNNVYYENNILEKEISYSLRTLYERHHDEKIDESTDITVEIVR